MPNFTIIVRNSDGDEWEEQYDKTVANPREWATDIIVKFNSNLRPGEKRRELVDVILRGESRTHNWEKTNLSTIIGYGGKLYDTCRCTRCGITGRRYVLGLPERDTKFKAKKYAICKGPEAVRHG